MKFEEEFPGLNITGLNEIEYYKVGIIVDDKQIEDELRGKGEILFRKKDIQKHCLDNQRVKDVIDKYTPTLPENEKHPSYDKYNTIQYILRKLKKELGLI